MDLISFPYDRSFVLEALRHSDIDYLEPVSEADERKNMTDALFRQEYMCEFGERGEGVFPGVD